MAWHIAYLSRVQAKKFPKLEKLLTKPGRKAASRRQTADQMLGIVKMLNAAFGGTVVDRTKH